jgi:hypothetical protein
MNRKLVMGCEGILIEGFELLQIKAHDIEFCVRKKLRIRDHKSSTNKFYETYMVLV